MLACTRIGATHTVVFGGFSAEALRDRINDCGAKLCITADGGWRRGKSVPLKANVDRALEQTPTVKSCLVVRRTNDAVEMKAGRDIWWDEQMKGVSAECAAGEPAVRAPALHPLHLRDDRQAEGDRAHDRRLPAGRAPDDEVRLRPARGRHLLVHRRHRLGHRAQLRRLRPALERRDHASCTKGAPDHPEKDRFWSIIERHKVSIFYTAPTAIRAFVRWGDELPKKHDLSSLRLLGSVGEPINPEAWMWYHEVIGGGALPDRRHLVADGDGRHHDDAAAGDHATPSRGAARIPFFGVDPQVVKRDGTPCGPNEGGFLVIKKPWPSMLRGIHGDPERYTEAVLVGDPGRLLHGRRLTPGRGRLLLGHGARRRRAQRRRPPPRHRRDRERAGLAPERRRGGRGRPAARAEGAGDLRASSRPRPASTASPELKKSLSRPRRQGDRRAGATRRDPLHRRAAEDPLGQDHAAPAARDRHQRRRPRRRDDARGHRRHQPPLRRARRRRVDQGRRPTTGPCRRPSTGQGRAGVAATASACSSSPRRRACPSPPAGRLPGGWRLPTGCPTCRRGHRNDRPRTCRRSA